MLFYVSDEKNLVFFLRFVIFKRFLQIRWSRIIDNLNSFFALKMLYDSFLREFRNRKNCVRKIDCAFVEHFSRKSSGKTCEFLNIKENYIMNSRENRNVNPVRNIAIGREIKVIAVNSVKYVGRKEESFFD